MKPNQRIHGIDALRAIAMILGIFLHATIAYKTIPLPSWPQDPVSGHWAFDYVYFFIHSFRMPLFFLIAGYFCRFLFLKVGERAFIQHRFKRIAIPFLGSMVLILPLTIFPFLVYHYSSIQPGNWNEIFRQSLVQLLHWNGMAHLWFLYYLIIYYTAVVVIMRVINLPLFKGIPLFISEKLSKTLTGSGLGVVISVIVLTLLLLPEPGIFLHVDTGIIPDPLYLAFFGVFFLAGWLVNINSTSFFNEMAKYALGLVATGIAISVFVFYMDFRFPDHKNNLWIHLVLKVLAAGQILLLVCGSTGFFLRFFKSESKLWKYISDASYWMYLLHLMIVATLQVLFLQFDWPGLVKFALILVITLTITLVTYQFWIRYGYIGTLLHGKRQKSPQH